MTRFRDLRIKHKLTAVILLTSTIALGLAVLTFVGYEILTFRSERVKTLTMLADVLASNSTGALAFDNETDAKEVLSALSSEPNILAAALYDGDGTLFASYLRNDKPFPFPMTPPVPGEAKFETGQFSISRPVNSPSEYLGVIYIVSDTQQMRDRLVRYAEISVLVFLACLLAATWISTQLQKLISVPIENLATAARQVTEQKDYNVRVDKQGEDELDLFTDAFNEMLTTIEERRHALQMAHDSLERRVKERTEQLESANEHLERSEETLRLAVDGAQIGVWRWEIDTNDLHWSERCHAIFGVPEDAGINFEKFRQALHPEDREPTNVAVQKAIETRGDFATEYRCIWPDDSLHWIEAMGRVFYDNDLNPLRMQGVVIDITERKNAETELQNYADELERSNRELRDFAYVASHDLKEPLRVVSSYCDLLVRRLAGTLDEKGERYVGHITSAAASMRRLISDLLDYSRIGTRSEPMEPTDLGAALEETLGNLSVTIENSDAKIVCAEPLPTVLADRGQLTQLFQNLIGNAIKFSKSDPQIEISAGRSPEKPGRWIIEVADNGPGIEPEFQEQIFKIFERLDANREIEGTGIGLAICRRILERHGGEIQVESQPGKGTRFSFDFAATGG